MKLMLQQFLIAFIPLFVAIDLVGLVPLFLGITQGLSADKLKTIAYQATFTAAGVALGFIFLGKMTFKLLGITVADFQIAGGLILMVLASRELIGNYRIDPLAHEDIGIVPLGMPLIAGPALMTTLLLLIDTVGVSMTLSALLLNLVIVAFTFHHARHLNRLVGKFTLKALSKVIALLLTAIAVNMVRRGLEAFL